MKSKVVEFNAGKFVALVQFLHFADRKTKSVTWRLSQSDTDSRRHGLILRQWPSSMTLLAFTSRRCDNDTVPRGQLNTAGRFHKVF